MVYAHTSSGSPRTTKENTGVECTYRRERDGLRYIWKNEITSNGEERMRDRERKDIFL